MPWAILVLAVLGPSVQSPPASSPAPRTAAAVLTVEPPEPPEPSVPPGLDSLGQWKARYLSRACRVADVGLFGCLGSGQAGCPAQAASGFDFTATYANRFRSLGCKLFKWGGSTWVEGKESQPLAGWAEWKNFAADSAYWKNAQKFITTVQGSGQPRRWNFALSEVVDGSRVTAADGKVADMAPDKCVKNAKVSGLRFREFYATLNAVESNNKVQCGNGTCKCSTDESSCANITPYCPPCLDSCDLEKDRHVPSIDAVATRNWWTRLASLACKAGYTDIEWSVFQWTGTLDVNNALLTKMMNSIRQDWCRVDASNPAQKDVRFGVERSLQSKPAGEVFAKRSALLKRVADCGSYTGCGCYSFSDLPPAKSSDLCIPKAQFSTDDLPVGAASPLVELDLEERWLFASRDLETRRRFIVHSMRSAKEAQKQRLPAYFAVPVLALYQGESCHDAPLENGQRPSCFLPDPPTGTPTRWYQRWWDAKESQFHWLCASSSSPQGPLFPAKGLVDAWQCGYDDLIRSNW